MRPGLILFFCFIISCFARTDTVLVCRYIFSEKAKNFEERFFRELIKSYNSNEKEKIVFQFKNVAKFNELFTILKIKSDRNIALSSITIKKERLINYDFSISYIPVRRSIFAMTNSTIYNLISNDHRAYRIGYYKNTDDEKAIVQYQKKYKLTPVALSPRESEIILAFKAKKIDLFLTEGITIYSDKRFRLIHTQLFQEQGYGIMYPKGSPLVKKIDPYIRDLIKSPFYYKLLIEYFGTDIANLLFKNQDSQE